MKKITLLAVAFVAVTLTSCVKDRTCECKDSSGVVTDTYTFHTTKSQATTLCTSSTYGGETCALK